MYHFTRRFSDGGMSPGTTERARRAIAVAATLIADSTEGLSFEPQEHRYSINGTKIRCVSDIVGMFAPFDTEAKARGAASNPRHRLYGKTPEEIVAIWEEKRDAAAAAGTLVHSFGEACYLYTLGQEEKMEDEYRRRVSPEGLAALTPKEEAAARWWNDMDMSRYVPAFKETRVLNPLLRYAGTLDLMLYDTLTDTFVMRDYKTNEDLFKWYGDMLATPLNMLKADDIGKYTVQQNLYKIALANIGIEVSQLSLVWLRDDASYMEVELPECTRMISYAVSSRNTESRKPIYT